MDDFETLCEAKGVKLFGDLPIFVARDSVDVWVRPQLFHHDVVAGVPPDYFSEEGQRWGTMLYDWEAHQRRRLDLVENENGTYMCIV